AITACPDAGARSHAPAHPAGADFRHHPTRRPPQPKETAMRLDKSASAVLEPGQRNPEPPPMSEQPFKSELLKTLQARGYIHQITHPAELDAAAAAGPITAYIGFDATAPSLHVGHLFSIMTL